MGTDKKSFLDRIRYRLSGQRASDIKSGRRRQMIGGGLAIAGAAPLLFFGTRHGYRVLKAIKAMRAGATSDLSKVQSYIADHLSRTGKALPKFRFATSAKDMPSAGFRIRFGEPPPIPVFSDRKMFLEGLNGRFKDVPLGRVMKLQARLSGPHFAGDYVYAGNGKVNPKVLLHELGHAADMKALGAEEMMRGARARPKSIREWLRTFTDPDKTGLVSMESRAWDNAGIAKGDKLRELALDTYRNAVQMREASLLATPMLGTGMFIRSNGKAKERRARGG
jgi:hypothetical protein